MFFISPYITNVILLVTIVLSGLQHVRLKRDNPVTNVQFGMMTFCMALIVVVALYDRTDPWLSLAFFIVAVGCLVMMLRQHRMLPPMNAIE